MTGAIESTLSGLSLNQLQALQYDWKLWARANQLTPVQFNWRVWLILAGRGWGKTRTGAEFIRAEVLGGRAQRIALLGQTWADVRDVMIEGPSGLLNIHAPWEVPKYEPSKKRLTWPNGAQAFAFSATEPDQLRGPQFDCAWADEIAKFDSIEAWDNLMLGLRLGVDPKCVATTTPRPLSWLSRLTQQEETAMTTGTTYDNASNLAPAFLDQIIKRYEGTRLGRQELEAQFLHDVPGALWNRAQLELVTINAIPDDLGRIVVAVDPATTSGENADETGIIVAGIRYQDGKPYKAYVLADLSLKASPNTWAHTVVKAYHTYQADRVIAESNQGGDMIQTLLNTIDPHIPYTSIHVSRGKLVRAEPVAALYEQHKIFHTRNLGLLEDQMCSFSGVGKSPDRLDALVMALTHLMLKRPYKVGMAKTSGW